MHLWHMCNILFELLYIIQLQRHTSTCPTIPFSVLVHCVFLQKHRICQSQNGKIYICFPLIFCAHASSGAIKVQGQYTTAPAIHKTWSKQQMKAYLKSFSLAEREKNSKTTKHLNISTLSAAFTNCKIPFATNCAPVFSFDVTFERKRASKEITVLKKSHSDGMTELNCKVESLFFRSFFKAFKTPFSLAFIK